MEILKNSLLALAVCAVPWGAQAADAPVNWYSLLKQSKPETQTEWAGKYEHGDGIKQDYTRAMYLYCAAASAGYVPAQYRLGWLYANGRGVSRDDAMAAAWFRVAADQGHAQAKNMLTMVNSRGPAEKPLCVLPREPGPAVAGLGSRPVAKVSAEDRRRVEKMVRRLAPQYGLDPALVMAVIQIESAFQHQAVSPKNAQGLMQLIPETADRFGVQDAMDPQQNLRGGMAYLRWLLAFFRGDVQLALAGYNAGENAVVKHQGIPPYPETQAYVAKIAQLYANRIHPPVAQVVKPAAITTAQYPVSPASEATVKVTLGGRPVDAKPDRGSMVPVIVKLRQPRRKGY